MVRTPSSGFRGRRAVIVAILLVLGSHGRGVHAQSATAVSFAEASVHLEQNVTDGDLEIVFIAESDDDGLVNLKVVSPDGRTVIDFTAPDPSTVGIRQFRFESPEPKDVNSLKAAYPEGTYRFFGKSLSGVALVSGSTLSYRLPKSAKFGMPAPEMENVGTKDTIVSWSAVAGVAAFIVEIENADLNTRIKATIPGSSTSLAVPNGFLMPGRQYQLAIGTVNAEGNRSFVETTFTTRK